GFVYAYPDVDPVHGTLIDNLHVLPAARGLGLGRSLLQGVVRALATHATSPALHLHVFDANVPARAFYARMGGVEVERFVKPSPDGHEYPEWLVAWPDARVLLAH
ncbi:MAG: GNAT family N-acetyltransferase, partial [Gemmatimonadaceae bacterium]|nr:GNAT family N-acetyltransferase [Gemmatimonadaceae bacterium]